MKVENRKIVEASEDELFRLYLEREMDDCMDFHEYRRRMEAAGCTVKDGDISVNKRTQKLEVLRIVEDGMIWLTTGDTGRMPKPLRDLLYALCKAEAMRLEDELKGR